MSNTGKSAMELIASIMGVFEPMTIFALRMLSYTLIAIAFTSGITLRMRLRNHHRSVHCNVKAHGLSGSGGMAK